MNMSNTPTYIYKGLKKRGVTVELIDDRYSLMRYKRKNKWHYLRGCVTEDVTAISRFICNTKIVAEKFAKDIGMPVPVSENYESFEKAEKFMHKYSPIVVKPLDSAHGNGISLNVTSKTELKKALKRVKEFSSEPPLLQQMVDGKDVRIMVIDGKYVAAVRRVPAAVVGDGKHSIEELIKLENRGSHRSSGKRGRLKIINLQAAKAFLKRRVVKVPRRGEKVSVVGMGNTSMGGHAEDFTDKLPAKIYKKAEKFAAKLNLPVCGVDIILDDKGNYHFIEANASPGFGPHHHPRVGKKRDVTGAFIDMLMKDKK